MAGENSAKAVAKLVDVGGDEDVGDEVGGEGGVEFVVVIEAELPEEDESFEGVVPLEEVEAGEDAIAGEDAEIGRLRVALGDEGFDFGAGEAPAGGAEGNYEIGAAGRGRGGVELLGFMAGRVFWEIGGRVREGRVFWGIGVGNWAVGLLHGMEEGETLEWEKERFLEVKLGVRDCEGKYEKRKTMMLPVQILKKVCTRSK